MLSLLHAAAWLHEDMFSFLFNILNTVGCRLQISGFGRSVLKNSIPRFALDALENVQFFKESEKGTG